MEEQNRKERGTTREAICGSFELYVLILTALQHGNQHDQKMIVLKRDLRDLRKLRISGFTEEQNQEEYIGI